MVNPLKTRVNRYDAETFLGASRRGPVTGGRLLNDDDTLKPEDRLAGRLLLLHEVSRRNRD